MGDSLKTDILNPSDATKEAVNYLTPPADVSASDYGIPVTANAVSNGNDTTTQLLLQDGITDTSAGATLPAVITNNGVTVDGNGDLIFDGLSTLTIDYTSAGLQDAWGVATNEWTLDFDIALTGGDICYCNMTGGPNGTFWMTSDATPNVTQGYVNIQMSASTTVKKTMTIERWLDGSTWKTTYYVNGISAGTLTSGATTWGPITSDLIFGFNFFAGSLVGKMNRIRLSNVAFYKGQNFTNQTTDYEAGTPNYDSVVTEVATPTPTNKMFGRNASNEAIEISIENLKKDIIYDAGAASGAVSLDLDNGDYQQIATVVATPISSLTMTNSSAGQWMVVEIDNANATTVTIDSVEFINDTETGTYLVSLGNNGAVIYPKTKTEI